MSPSILVPLAERSGLIVEIGQWVLERACSDRHRWQSHRPADDLAVSVNVSAHQLMSPDYARSVSSVLAGTGTDPNAVTLEITESVFVQDSERALVVLNELKRIGVQLALDDFGTGYSSLSYLNRFPIDVVKIDRAFVVNLGIDPASEAIVLAVIDLGHTLGMSVVAEGVETATQHRHLISLGCDFCQGYYFARPMNSDDVDSLLVQPELGGSTYLPPNLSAA